MQLEPALDGSTLPFRQVSRAGTALLYFREGIMSMEEEPGQAESDDRRFPGEKTPRHALSPTRRRQGTDMSGAVA